MTGLVKKHVILFCLSIFTFLAFAGCKPSSPTETTFAAVIKNPKNYESQLLMLSQGIVAEKKQNGKNLIALIAGNQFFKTRTGDAMTSERTIIIKLRQRDYERIKIGSMIDVQGRMKTAIASDGSIFYIKTKNLRITGYRDINSR
jgi:mevalonate pyrophosphate decarboxylase